MKRFAILMVVIAGVAAGGSLAVATSGAAGPTRSALQKGRSGAVVRCDADGFRYMYHVPTGRESLFDLAVDPHELHDVLVEHKEIALGLRRALEARLSVRSLDDLRIDYASTIQRLRSLGYL